MHLQKGVLKHPLSQQSLSVSVAQRASSQGFADSDFIVLFFCTFREHVIFYGRNRNILL